MCDLLRTTSLLWIVAIPVTFTDDLKALMCDVLSKNNFTFMDSHYLQILGTSMGTRMAPSFSCLFMSRLEQQMLDAALACRSWIWWRFIDDVFFIWTRNEESLHTFINHINSFHRTIKLTSKISHQQVNFLDVSIRIKEHDTLINDLYTKPTDTHQYLLSTSCHPRHCENGIAYSQALRLRRICFNDSNFSRHTQNFKMYLVSRGHSAKKVQQAINRARSVPRPSALEQKPINDVTKSRIPLVVTFHPNLPPFLNITNDNHHILHTSDRLQRAVPETPDLAYRRPRDLRDFIVRAKVPPITDVNSSPIQHGNFRCGTNRCVVCKDHIKEGDTFTSHGNNTSHQIRVNITRSTSNVIYLISCRICGIQYVGATRTTPKRRFYGQRSTVNTKKIDTPVGQHLNLPNHSITDMISQGIESLDTRPDTVRTSREKMWMRRLRTVQPHGLNIQEGSN